MSASLPIYLPYLQFGSLYAVLLLVLNHITAALMVTGFIGELRSSRVDANFTAVVAQVQSLSYNIFSSRMFRTCGSCRKRCCSFYSPECCVSGVLTVERCFCSMMVPNGAFNAPLLSYWKSGNFVRGQNQGVFPDSILSRPRSVG